jgi:hypothetical protein
MKRLTQAARIVRGKQAFAQKLLNRFLRRSI